MIKKNQSTRLIPVIIFSALDNLHSITAATGADDILEKPFEIDVLLEKIAAHLIHSVNLKPELICDGKLL
jgi:DNA-binding response OmpR family regulator